MVSGLLQQWLSWMRTSTVNAYKLQIVFVIKPSQASEERKQTVVCGVPRPVPFCFYCLLQLQSQVGEGRCFSVNCSEKAKEQALQVLKHFNVQVSLADIFSRCQVGQGWFELKLVLACGSLRHRRCRGVLSRAPCVPLGTQGLGVGAGSVPRGCEEFCADGQGEQRHLQLCSDCCFLELGAWRVFWPGLAGLQSLCCWLLCLGPMLV